MSNAQCGLSVTFSPSIDASIKGGVAVSNSSSVSPQILSANGTGLLPVTFTPASLTFAAQPVGTTSAPKTLKLTNNLATTLSLTSLVASGTYAIAPGGATPCGATIAAGANCTANVTFTPNKTGSTKGAVTVTHGAAFSPQVVKLTGTGQ